MNKTKLGIIVAALGGAVAIFLLTGGEEEIPTDSSDPVSWMCAACNQTFDLTWTQTDTAMAAENGRQPIACQRCPEKKAYMAMTCNACGGKYLGPEVPGSTGECPKCKPDAVAPPEEEAVEEGDPNHVVPSL